MPRSTLDGPFHQLGGDEELVRRLVRSFYARMAAAEPALLNLHRTDEQGQIAPEAEERFACFLIEWLGGPERYSPEFGHPRLRMRHHKVPIDSRMRDAWLRTMTHALDQVGVSGDVRRFLDARFAEVADFLRNERG